MTIEFSGMTIADYDEVRALWEATEGVGLSAADSREGIAQFLERNAGLSAVARDGGHLVGAVLCGHDGRRGYIHHLAVHPSWRRQGVGRALVERCLAGLASAGIQKCHLFVFAANQPAIAFWAHIGWQQRIDLAVMSETVPDDAGVRHDNTNKEVS